ncbi:MULTISPECIES: LCP family protein [unclassified Nocardia]|uniref:LCP family protein n=1 Tax=unclassified Nocardia TaxID=2637762 RepID=UPI001CE43A17|nr:MULTISPECIES: LCP family protein [unclassified Nocardia]
MGDDRHGHSPRPSGRAPWERYPAAEYTERDGARASRRARHADEAPASGPAPLTVHELVERVDSERSGRATHAARPNGAKIGTGSPATGFGAGVDYSVDNGSESDSAANQYADPAIELSYPAAHSEPITAGSPVLQDILSSQPESAPASQITDKLPAVIENDTAATESDDNTARPKTVGLTRLALNKQRKRRRLRLAGQVTGALFAVIALVLTGGGWAYQRYTDKQFTHVSAIDDDKTDVIDSDGQLGDENFLIVGTDSRAGANGDVGAGTTADADGARSDTVMLVNIPASRARVVAVSFPRDLDVTRPACQGWNNDKGTYTDDTYPSAIGDKLNAVYALGGPKCLVNVIRKMSGLNIGHFIGIDFAGFEAMVNQVGGVEVCAPKPVVDGVLGTVLDHPGKQRIDGATALNYVRARHVYGEERSDYDRIHRQQRFLSSLLRESLSSRVLFDPGKFNGFISAFTAHTFVDNVKTPDLLMLGRSLQKMDAGSVTFLTVPTAGTTSYGNEIPREADIKAIFRAIIDDQPLPGEKKSQQPQTSTTQPPAPPKLTAVDPRTVTVQVTNGSGVAGAAQRTATKLANQTFQIYSTTTSPDGISPTTRIRYSPGHEAEAATLASAVPGATLEQTSELGSIVELLIGSDFGGTVRAPTPVAAPLPELPPESRTATPVTLPPDLEHVNAADEACT